MKIFAIGRNYAAHIKELSNEHPDEPIIFTKPDTAILRHNAAFCYPDFSQNIHYETELIIRISQKGKKIALQQAHKHYNSIGIGIDFTARDLQQKAKEKGLPWDIAKGFDGSAPVSDDFLPISHFKKQDNIAFRLEVNNQIKQQGNTSLMLFSFDHIVSYISRFFTLNEDDMIFTGTPEGVGSVARGDRLIAYIEDKKMLECEIK